MVTFEVTDLLIYRIIVITTVFKTLKNKYVMCSDVFA